MRERADPGGWEKGRGDSMEFTVREGNAHDLPFLREMLFEAAYWRPGVERPPTDEALSRPDIAKLLRNWGRDGDASVIAERADNQRAGAAWYRFWNDHEHSYGYVSADIPELAIAVAGELRGKGIGGELLRALKNLAADRGIESLSLSVERDNPARHLYRKHGFEPVELAGNSLTMIARIDNGSATERENSPPEQE